MWQAFSCCFTICVPLGKGGSTEHAGILPPLHLAALESPASQDQPRRADKEASHQPAASECHPCGEAFQTCLSDCLRVAQMMQREDPGRIWQLLSFIYLSFTFIHWWVYWWQELSDKSLLPSVAYEITSMWRTLDLGWGGGGPTWVAEQPVHTILSSVQLLTGDAFVFQK